MDLFTDLASELLMFAKAVFGPGVCPGEWVWATSTAGALIALLPIAAAMAVALIRKITANTYNRVTLSAFGLLGVTCVLLVPWVLMVGVSEVTRSVFTGGNGGLSGANASSMRSVACDLVGNQAEYLGKGLSVFDMLFYPQDNKLAYGFYLAALVGLPLLALVFVMLQARIAFRRGPKWPARLFWAPFVVLVLATFPVAANTALQLWLGFLPITILGLAPVALLGPPSWQAVRRAEQRDVRRDQAPPAPPSAHLRQNTAQPPAPAKDYPPTALAPVAAAPAVIPAAPVPAGGSGQSKYRRIRKLGHGGFGTVWEAEDTLLGRRVALKIAHAPDAETEQRMEREARALAAMDHPNCVRVYDLAEEPDGMALVMEYLEGRALADAVDGGGRLDDVAAARLWSTMASALTAAHAKGVLHRDVKPSNVIVDPNGLPHLIDFGIARSKGDATMTATGMMIGTPDYTAPEIANGAAASPASDAWQLAATVSYSLTGKPPRGERENPMAALLAAARAEAPRELPASSVHGRLLAAALDAEPRNRPTLGAVVTAMNNWLAKVGESREGPVTGSRRIPR